MSADELQFFDNKLAQKQAELVSATEAKLTAIQPTSVPSLEARLRGSNDNTSSLNLTQQLEELSNYRPILDQQINGLPDYKSALNQQVAGLPQYRPKAQTPNPQNNSNEYVPLDVQTNRDYIGNVAGAFVSGAGSLVSSIASIPDEIANGIGAKSEAFLQEQFPVLADEIRNTGYGFRVASGALRSLGETIQEGGDYFYDSKEATELNAKVSQAYDDNTGAVDVGIAIAGTVVSNPAAIPELVAQSLPHMIALAKNGSTFALAFTGMTSDRVSDAVEVYKNTHNGQEPTGADYNLILSGAIASTAIETIQSRFLLSKSASITQAVAVKSGKLGVVAKALPLGTVTKGTVGGITEFGQEGIAAGITEFTGRADYSLDALTSDAVIKPAVIAGSMGAGPGAALGGGVQLIPDIGKVVKPAIQATAAKVEKVVATDNTKRTEAAINANDPMAAVEVMLEKNVMQLATHAERVAHVMAMNTQLDLLAEALKSDPNTEDLEQKTNAYLALDDQVYDVQTAIMDQRKIDTGTTPTVDNERLINSDETTPAERKDAIESVITDIQDGVELQSRTVASIKGSAEFENLSEKAQETFELYKDKVEAKQVALENRGTGKDPSSVNQDIIKGSRGYLGVEGHERNVAKAIQLGNVGTATKSISQLSALLTSQVNKLNNGYIKNGVQTNHTEFMHKQIKSEIDLIHATLLSLNSNVKIKFGETLTEAELTKPKLNEFQVAAKTETKPKPKPKTESTANVVPTPKSETTEESTQATEEVQVTPEPKVRRRKQVVELKALRTETDPLKQLGLINAIYKYGERGDSGAITIEERFEIDTTVSSLSLQGYKIVRLFEGQWYNEGMKADVEFKFDGSLRPGTQTITSVKKPQINKDGVMVQAAEITVSEGPSKEEVAPTVAKPAVQPEVQEAAVTPEPDVVDETSDQASDQADVGQEVKAKLDVVYDMEEAAKDDPLNILNITIPESAAYTAKRFNAKAGDKAKTYRDFMIEKDNILRAIKDIIGKCNG